MSFRLRLILTMLFVVVTLTGTTVFLTRCAINRSYDDIIQDLFRQQAAIFSKQQKIRFENVKKISENLASSVRLFAALEEGEAELIYQTTGDELRELRGSYSFFRVLDGQGRVIAAADARAGMLEGRDREELNRKIEIIAREVNAMESPQEYGFIVAGGGNTPALQEVIFSKIYRYGGQDLLGALVLGFPVTAERGGEAQDQALLGGIYLEERFHSITIDPVFENAIIAALSAKAAGEKKTPGHTQVKLEGHLYRLDFSSIEASKAFAQAYQVSLYPLDPMLASQAQAVRNILIVGLAAMLLAIILSSLLGHNIAVPVFKLVKGTHQIKSGRFDTRVAVKRRDEIGQLADAFNEMAEGLEAREKLRGVLHRVAGKEIAERLTGEGVELGGEVRRISVLFCDIRGFTSLTEHMAPGEVIELLNEHMSAMTKVVHNNHGVVDKFVGDLIMAVFGAPRSYGEDSAHAIRCAFEMLQERARLNESSKYVVSVGVGVATGEALVGCMGSDERLDYTVIGERVNLASRLCSKAAAGQIMIDQQTANELQGKIEFESVPSLQLKGFAQPVNAYRLLTMRA